ncbi:sensor histidine kinase [Tellurirhabdus rosea]|uniref:sensor histidine kinase n=1 Tax=Tellurirhabdus rosea TaxID=2674997 RepID=UPI0022517AC5|nr:sensor histidine kinase [Tellurirhabdus rosea]
MKTTPFTRRDTVFALGILPLYYLLLNYLLFGEVYFRRADVFVLSSIGVLLVWTPVYFLHALPAGYLRRWYPDVRHIWRRLLLGLLIHVVLSSLAILLLFYGYEWSDFPGYTFSETRLYTALLCGLAGELIVGLVHESLYTFERWSQTLSETEKYRRASLQSQLESLKQQINPHFLFNSLNSLSSLIDDDPERADEFIEELSSVYRYLLKTNEGELTTLAAELRFIQSYFHLQHTRYGSGLSLHVQVTEEFMAMLLPPLTLQLLVENAIKHNVVAADQPLEIWIETSLPEAAEGEPVPGYLRVRNNLQRRASRVLSNGVGLTNIETKYDLLGRHKIRISNEDGQFSVTLPLLASQPVFQV